MKVILDLCTSLNERSVVALDRGKTIATENKV